MERGGDIQFILPTACAAPKGVFFGRAKVTARVQSVQNSVRVAFSLVKGHSL